jgi:outer membrane protein OmpA-like peptidoglycan-associated protein
MPSIRLPSILIFFTPLLMASNCRKPPEDAVISTMETVLQSPEIAVQIAVVEPSFGPAEEAFEIEVIGSTFMVAARVRIGANESPRVRFLDENTLDATVPPLAQGTYDVTVINPDGSESTLRSALVVRDVVPEVRCEDVVAYFEYNSDGVTDAAKLLIRTAAECMGEAQGQIVLEGHTDERGTTRYNLSLGQRRAESVKRLLVSKGIAPSRARGVSYGEERPADSASNEAAWSKNRRVEIKLVEE